MFIDGVWVTGGEREALPILNHANGAAFRQVVIANENDVERALQAAKRSFDTWSRTSTSDRQKILEAAERLMESTLESIAESLTQAYTQPLAEARMELNAANDVRRWYLEEGKRAYCRIVPPRISGMRQSVIHNPTRPVIAFVAWNFPAINFMRKVAGTLAAGCSFVIKPSEETPITGNRIAKAFADAGLQAGVLNVINGDPAQISKQMCASPIPHKLIFTGSTEVGKHLWALASQNLLRCTMKLGGHAPFIVVDEANVELSASLMMAGKLRNAGQVCVFPMRFYVQASIYEDFLDVVIGKGQKMRVGDGMQAEIDMGLLINQKRDDAMEALLADSLNSGAQIACRGEIPSNDGSFFAPTILQDVPETARIMNEERFGPIATVVRFDSLDEVMQQANRLPHGLAAYAFTTSAHRATQVSDRINASMTAINSLHIASPKTLFGGVDWSGQGPEGLDTFLRTRVVIEQFL